MNLVSKVLSPVLTMVMAIVVANCNEGCAGGLPKLAPNAEEMEAVYNLQLTMCETQRPYPACLCKISVKESNGMCDHPAWPRFGICDNACDSLAPKGDR